MKASNDSQYLSVSNSTPSFSFSFIFLFSILMCVLIITIHFIELSLFNNTIHNFFYSANVCLTSLIRFKLKWLFIKKALKAEMSKCKHQKQNDLKEVIMPDVFTVSIKTLQAALRNFSIQIWHIISFVSHWEWISYVIKHINAQIMTSVQTILILWPKEMHLCTNNQPI